MDALTPSEHRVAALVAQGLANREVAQALFVTPKTIEHHLTSVFRKLNVASRDELAQIVAEGTRTSAGGVENL